MKCKTIVFWGQKHTWWKLFLGTFCAVMFLLAIYAIAYHDTDLWNLWLPTSQYNDDVIYNRQLAGVLTNGQPRGYFGYNESHAMKGHFGAWGPVLIYLYAVPGLLIGHGVNAMFWCNVVFAVVGWAIFSFAVDLAWKRQLLFGIAVACIWLPVQQVFTGTAEPVLYFLILVIIGATIRLRQKWSVQWYIVLAMGCFFFTVVRAYTVLFWIFPICILWKQKRKWCFVSALLALLSIAGYFVVTKWYNAPYFTSGDADYTVFELFFKGKVIEAFFYEINRMSGQATVLWKSFLEPTLHGNPQPQGVSFLVLVFLLFVTVLSTVIDGCHGRKIEIRVYAGFCTLLSLLALFGMYEMDPMARHCTMLGLVLLIACVYECHTFLPFYLPTLLFPLLFSKSLMYNRLPTYASQMDLQIQQISTALQQSQQDNESDDPWSCTIAYAYGDNVFHGYLYAVPAGMGIQFDQSGYLANTEKTIYSRYVMAGHGTETEERLLADGWQVLVSTEDLVIYENVEGKPS